MQGDIVAIYNTSGTKIGSYTYNAYGYGSTSVTSGVTTLERNIVQSYNPFRYRGYYFDSQTGYYYLQTRYYDPLWGRFINADPVDVITATPMGLTDKNLYAYCDNNPIMRVDKDGEFWNLVIGAGVGAVTAIAGQVVSDVVTSILSGELYYSDWQTYAGVALGGATSGIILASTGNAMLADVAYSAISTAATMSLKEISGEADYTFVDIVAYSGEAVVSDYILSKTIRSTKVKNVTTGRGNYGAVYNRGLTRMRNGTASVMSGSVVAKGIWSGIVEDTYSNVYSGFENHWNCVKHHFGF